MNSSKDHAEWYLLQTKARQEQVAAQNLERQNYCVCLPQLRLHRRGKVRIEPMFPGYVFVRLNSTVDNFAPIRSTFGVLRLVRFADVYARVPDQFVDNLRRQTDSDGVCDFDARSLRPGDRVEITDGAFAGYRAVVAQVHKRDRIALLFEVAGKHIAIVTPGHVVQNLD